jgi:hypothetical protein
VQAESPVVDGQDPDGLLDVVEGGAGQLGLGSQKFSKSTDDRVSASPAPLIRSHSSPSPTRIVVALNDRLAAGFGRGAPVRCAGRRTAPEREPVSCW